MAGALGVVEFEVRPSSRTKNPELARCEAIDQVVVTSSLQRR